MTPRRLTAKEQRRYRALGWTAADAALPDKLLEPARAVAQRLARRRPWQELLCGIHNPFGHHACTAEAWKLLDIAEDPALLDLIEDTLGPDIILWDSELHLDPSALCVEEAQWWPVEPLAGTIAMISLERGNLVLIDIRRMRRVRPHLPLAAGAHYVLRYLPATSHFNRDARFPANRRAAEARVLVNYAKRPIWLLRGTDGASNDFATGFSVPAAQWAGAAAPEPSAKQAGAGGRVRKES